MQCIGGGEFIGTVTGPQRETTIGRLAGAQLHHGAVQRSFGIKCLTAQIGARFHQLFGQVGLGCHHDGGQGLAGNLLGATVWVRLQIAHQARGKGPGRGRYRQATLGKVGVSVQLALKLPCPHRRAALYQGDKRRSGPHTQVGREFGAALGVAGAEHHTGRTQCRLGPGFGVYAEHGCALTAFVDLQGLHRLPHDFQPGVHRQSQLDGGLFS